MKNKKVYFIDVDGTLVHNNIVFDECMKYGCSLPKHYDLSDLPDTVRFKCYDAFTNVNRMCKFDLYAGVKDILYHIAKVSDIYFITSRNEDMLIYTMNMIDKLLDGVDVGGRIHAVGNESKSVIINDIISTYVGNEKFFFIDDCYEHCIDVAKNTSSTVNMTTVLISNEYTTYNHKYMYNHKMYTINERHVTHNVFTVDSFCGDKKSVVVSKNTFDALAMVYKEFK